MKNGVLFLLSWGLCSGLWAQETNTRQWYLLDLEKDGWHGISLDKAYRYLDSLKRKPKTVVVAVLDSGIDTLHEDLRPNLWRNSKEIPGNGIDDDRNGYIDDVHGWNFIGSKDGRNIEKAGDEKVRLYHRFKEKFESPQLDTTALSSKEKSLYQQWKRASAGLNYSEEEKETVQYMEMAARSLGRIDMILQGEMRKKEFSLQEMEAFEPSSKMGKEAKMAYLRLIQLMELDGEEKNTKVIKDLNDYVESKKTAFEGRQKKPADVRQMVVGDRYDDFSDRFYGNNNVMGPGPVHGTHVAGIIGAVRNNGLGIQGIADQVLLMPLRVVPDGDEYDKDVALAIRYAVDNGAAIINMSFGKDFSPEKEWVDSAIQYALSKNVLLVHAAGNDGTNLDSAWNFPNAHLGNQATKAPHFITVGASSDPKLDGNVVANFSNYGQKEVDLFAPGMKIVSTLPHGNNYGKENGTSMAAPVVSGVAALLKIYFPQLSATDIKNTLTASAIRPAAELPCALPGEKSSPCRFDQLSVTGGLVNAYAAVQLAFQKEQMAKTKKQ